MAANNSFATSRLNGLRVLVVDDEAGMGKLSPLAPQWRMISWEFKGITERHKTHHCGFATDRGKISEADVSRHTTAKNLAVYKFCQ